MGSAERTADERRRPKKLRLAVAIRYGAIDRHDPITGRCLVSEFEPLDLIVHGQRVATYTTCPRLLVPARIWQALDFAALAREGHWPIGRGMLNESASFMSFCLAAWNEIDRWQARVDPSPPM